MIYFHDLPKITKTLHDDPRYENDLVKRKFLASGEHVTANIVILSDTDNLLHTQKNHDEILVVIEGKFAFQVDSITQTVSPGDLIFIPKGVLHGPLLKAGETLTVLSVYGPYYDTAKKNIIWQRDT